MPCLGIVEYLLPELRQDALTAVDCLSLEARMRLSTLTGYPRHAGAPELAHLRSSGCCPPGYRIDNSNKADSRVPMTSCCRSPGPVLLRNATRMDLAYLSPLCVTQGRRGGRSLERGRLWNMFWIIYLVSGLLVFRVLCCWWEPWIVT